MQKCPLIIMAVAGILLGVVLFVFRRAISPKTCKNCGTLKRELLLNAVIVSGLLSCLCSCGSRALSKDAENATAKEAPAGAVPTSTQTFEQTKEWQELKVLWNLITGNLDFLQDDADSRRMGFPGWKLALLNAAVDYRMTQMDRLVQQGILSENTRKAIATLFTDMVRHVGRSNSGATCYAMTEEGGRWANAMRGLETQAKELRKHYRDGSLKDDVLKDIETQLQEKLRVLDILGFSQVDEITDDEINARIRQWRQQGRIHVRWIDDKTRREVQEEITKEKESKLSRGEVARRRDAWNRDQEMILALAVDLGRYTPDRKSEKEIEKEFSGKVARDRIMARLKTDNSYEKESLVEGLATVGGEEAVPVLKELLNDMTMSSYRSTSASYDSNDPQAMEKYERSMTGYVNYPVRDAAATALRALGVNAPGESKQRAESPEGRAMVKEALGSNDPEVRRSAIRAAGMTRDKTLIPEIEKILRNDSLAVDAALYAFGEIGDASVLPLVISEADKGDADPWAIGPTLKKIGTKESLGYLQKLTFSSKDPSMRECAIRLLSETKDESFLPVFKEALKDKDIVVKLSAAIALQDIGCEDGFPALAEAAKASDGDLRIQALHALKQSKNSRAGEFLKTYANTPDGDGQKDALLTIIGKGGEDGRLALETILNGSDSEQKRRALNWVGNSTAAIPGIEAVLTKALDNTDEDLRRAVVWALKDKGTTNAIPALLAYCQSRQDDVGGGMAAGEAIKEIKKRTAIKQLGSFLSDITGDDKTKFEQAEKRKASLSVADVEALIVALDDYGRPEPQRKAAERMLKDLGKRSVGSIIQHFSEQPSDMPGRNWQLMEILDDHMDETIPAVMAFIGDTGKYNREVGIQVLSERGPRSKEYPLDKIDGLKDLLAKCSSDKDKKVRAAAQRLLIQMGGAGGSALDTVLAGLNDPSWDVRFETILSIKYDRKGRQWTSEQKSRIASTLVAMLAESKGAKDYLNARYIIDALEQFQDKVAIPVLEKLVRAGEPDDNMTSRLLTRSESYTPLQQAARLLFTMSDEATIPFWKEATGNSDDVVTLWAHAALYKLSQNPDENLKRIGEILHDARNLSVRTAGLDVTKALKDKRSIPILRQYLQRASSAAGKSIDPLPQVVSSSGHEEDRQEAFELLADLGGKDVLDDIKRIFREDQDGYVRRDAADQIITLAGTEALPLLLSGLQDRSPGVRYHICELLGVVGGEDVILALKKIAESDPYQDDNKGVYPVRDEAKRALKKLDILSGGGTEDRLVREAKKKDNDLRFWAIERLGESKDKPAVIETLTELLKDPAPMCTCGQHHVRQAAAESLRKLGKQVTEKENGVFEVLK